MACSYQSATSTVILCLFENIQKMSPFEILLQSEREQRIGWEHITGTELGPSELLPVASPRSISRRSPMRTDCVNDQWTSGAGAARMLGCSPRQVPKLASKGLLTVRRLPGCDARYLLSDVTKLASLATLPATNSPAELDVVQEGESHERS